MQEEVSMESVRTYWQTAPAYLTHDKTYYDIAIHIQAWRIAESVFEFGCNSGLCLKVIKERMPLIRTFGIDLNNVGIKYGKLNFGLDLVCADHTYLKSMQDKSFDICLTRSVLCHIPESYIQDISDNLKRIAKQFVLIVEPPSLEGRSTGHTWIYDYTKYGFKEIKTRLTDKGDPYTFWVCHTNL
jgi:2-polyprenyl-3-methyl-5-hydroxy-6-metoxy-1,4-benzoquinol methylase